MLVKYIVFKKLLTFSVKSNSCKLISFNFKMKQAYLKIPVIIRTLLILVEDTVVTLF